MKSINEIIGRKTIEEKPINKDWNIYKIFCEYYYRN
jgi:hypothetical protein